ncbi:hypothetical protein ACRE62_22930, partial [Klebsiella pneumoniae]
RKRAYCLKIQPATGSFARNLIYSTKPMFGKGLSSMLKEYGLNYGKRRTNQRMQTNLALRDESNADWLPRCNERTAI